MIKQVINIQHRKFATGLFWQPVTVGTNPYLYARQLADKGTKKYTLFVEYKSMIGLGNSRDGIRSGMPSAAAMVTGALSGFISFLGVFQVDGYYYLVAARNDVIIRDILIESEVEARKVYAELSNIPDWGALFAPASWGMPRSQEKFLSDLMMNGAIEKLRQISMTKSIALSVGLGVGFLVLLGLFLYTPLSEVFSKKETKATINPELMAEYQRQLEEKNKELDKKFDIVKKEKKPLDYPYNHLPDVGERARLCYKAVGFMMQPVMGWNQEVAKCDESYADVTFRRGFGTLNDFYAVGGDVLPGGIVNQVSNDEISVRVRLPELKTYASLDERDQGTVMRDILSIFQQLKVINGNVKASNITVKNEDASETVNTLLINANSKLVPSEFVKIFDGFDGVYMRSVKWNVRSRSWDYDLVIYTK